ncbi:ABC transporter ATP-binding protein [Reyranella sp.]|jgi:ABC-type branched-subunit amino acid transport system ATPase component|uniref:ABC transporter ATP-binding protein n=1 Tax=Reyranella sp. TaxID=1929291 RepID=UPI002F92F7F9
MILEVNDVRAGYDRLEILQGVSLSVAPGQIVGIIGPNGAGKSTLLKSIFGYIRPFSGRIALRGEILNGCRPDQVMRRRVGFVAQAGGLFAEMTIEENLLLGGYSVGDTGTVRGAIREVYDRFPLFRERRRQLAGSLSGGEQRLLAIARSLIIKPELLLLDEPSAALAPRFIDEVYETLRKLNAQGIAMLVVEQNTGVILDTADRVFVLEMGTNAFDGTPAELLADDRIRRLYLGSEAA